MKHLVLTNRMFIKLLKSFDIMVIAKGYSRSKYCNYTTLVNEFLYFIEKQQIKKIDAIRIMHVRAYYNYIRNRPNDRNGNKLSDSTIKKHLLSVRMFFDHLMEIEVIQASPVYLNNLKLRNAREPFVLTVNEIKRLFKACIDNRERSILSVAYGCGLRRSEISSLNLYDISFANGTLIVREGKYYKNRTIPLAENSIKHLKSYVKNERILLLKGQKNDAFFINLHGRRMCGITVMDCLHKIVNRTGDERLIECVTLHSLRHSIATHLLNNGAQMEFVRRFLGHVYLDTTHLYCKKRNLKATVVKKLNVSYN